MGWKVPGTNIVLGNIVNLDKSQPTRTKIAQAIAKRQLFRTREDVGRWRNALVTAENTTVPNRTDLIRVFKDVELDCHIEGILNTIKNKIKAKQFAIIDSNGEQDEEKTALLEKVWFFDFLEFIVESRFWGFSLVQLGDIVDDGFPNIEMIPRENVVPEFDLVKKDSLLPSIKDMQGFKYLEDPFKDWYIYIGKKNDFGLFNKAAPHALSKKNLFNEMWEFGELFGMPIRKGHTDTTDPERRKNMETMLENMGSAAWGVFDKEDDIDFAETAKGDATKVFIEPIKLSNEEISKCFAGQSGTFDTKAFVGSAEVQERLFQEFVISFMRQVKFVVNNDLLPRMVTHKILPEGFKFKWIAEEVLTVMNKADIITKLFPHVNITPEIIEKELGIEVELKPNVELEPPTVPTSVMKKVTALYKGVL